MHLSYQKDRAEMVCCVDSEPSYQEVSSSSGQQGQVYHHGFAVEGAVVPSLPPHSEK